MNYNTHLEARCLDLLVLVAHYLTRNNVKRYEYVDLMGKIRDLISALQARESGCFWGKHFGPCTCRPEKSGEHVMTRYYAARRAR